MRVFLAVVAILIFVVVGLLLWFDRDTQLPGLDVSSLTPEAVPSHVAALRDSNASIRKKAAESLWKIGVHAKAALPALLAALRDPDEGVRVAAARALGRAGQGTLEAVPVLTEALKDDRAAVRAAAAEALAEIWGEERYGPMPVGQRPRPTVEPSPAAKELHRAAVPLLTALLRDGDAQVRARAAAAFAEISPFAIPALPDLIGVLQKDPDVNARLQATLVMANLGPPARPAVPALAERLRTDPDAGIRVNAAYALGVIRADPELSVPALFEAYLTDDVGDVQNTSLGSLQKFGEQARLAEARAREVVQSPSNKTTTEMQRRAAQFLELLEGKLKNNSPQSVDPAGQLPPRPKVP